MMDGQRSVRDHSEDNECRRPSRKPGYWQKDILPGKYDGSTPLDVYMTKFGQCAMHNKWDAEHQKVYLAASLEGPAAQILATDPMTALSVTRRKRKLQERFGVAGKAPIYRAQLKTVPL